MRQVEYWHVRIQAAAPIGDRWQRDFLFKPTATDLITILEHERHARDDRSGRFDQLIEILGHLPEDWTPTIGTYKCITVARVEVGRIVFNQKKIYTAEH